MKVLMMVGEEEAVAEDMGVVWQSRPRMGLTGRTMTDKMASRNQESVGCRDELGPRVVRIYPQLDIVDVDERLDDTLEDSIRKIVLVMQLHIRVEMV